MEQGKPMAKNIPVESLEEFQRRVFDALDEACGYAYPVSEFQHLGVNYSETLKEIENAAYWLQVGANRMRAAARTARKRAKTE